MPWMMPAIFNVADIFIVCGMITVALLVVLGIRFDGTREKDHVAADTEVVGTEIADTEAADTEAADTGAVEKEA